MTAEKSLPASKRVYKFPREVHQFNFLPYFLQWILGAEAAKVLAASISRRLLQTFSFPRPLPPCKKKSETPCWPHIVAIHGHTVHVNNSILLVRIRLYSLVPIYPSLKTSENESRLYVYTYDIPGYSSQLILPYIWKKKPAILYYFFNSFFQEIVDRNRELKECTCTSTYYMYV